MGVRNKNRVAEQQAAKLNKKEVIRASIISFLIGGALVFVALNGRSSKAEKKDDKNDDRPIYSTDYVYIGKTKEFPSHNYDDPPKDPIHYYRWPLGFWGLFTLTKEEVENLDLGMMNLLCAQSLPGEGNEGNFNPLPYVKKLDEWAEKVKLKTKESIHLFNENPRRFHYSEGYFKMLVMTSFLQKDMGIEYNPSLAGKRKREDFKDSRDLFINGPLGERKTGTCASLPVVYVAIGQRLGYPVRLAYTREHLFARWEKDDKTERFNIEITNKGMVCHSDEYYQNWPWKLTKDEINSPYFFGTLNQFDALAVFLALRSNCFRAQKDPKLLPHALLCDSFAHFLEPESPQFFSGVIDCIQEEVPFRKGIDFSNLYQGDKLIEDFEDKVYVQKPIVNIKQNGQETIYTFGSSSPSNGH